MTQTQTGEQEERRRLRDIAINMTLPGDLHRQVKMCAAADSITVKEASRGRGVP